MRYSGRVTAFPLLGEPLAVDLANTVVRLRGREVDLLDADGTAAWLAEHPLPGKVSSAELRAMRDAVREVFDASIMGRPVAEDCLDLLNNRAESTKLELVSTPDGPVPAWEGDALGLLARSAIAVVAGEAGTGLRACANHDCVLFFALGDDRRRFCDTKTCANRARQARHRAKVAGP